MKRLDWAGTVAVRICDSRAAGRSDRTARALRAAERRGFRRAVKMLREEMNINSPPYGDKWADWLEERERK